MTNAGLTRVARYNLAQHSIVDCHFVDAQTVPFNLARPQVAASDRDLLFGRVAIEPDHFHTVEERSRNRFCDVRRGNEQHV